jgi:hypothetical protein
MGTPSFLKTGADKAGFAGFKASLNRILDRLPVIEGFIEEFERGMRDGTEKVRGEKLRFDILRTEKKFDVYFQVLKFYNESLEIARKILVYYGIEATEEQRKLLRQFDKLKEDERAEVFKRIESLRGMRRKKNG